ncbi:MAG: flagellar basal-body rod protein FlgF [Thermoleophilaceae bacterium]|nr:flagellar basal-body rod protein FlgF [Thermoleophilaceae bacterium]
MERGLNSAASGMLAEMVRQDQIANDLANASTPGYKADRATQKSFGDILLANTVDGQTVGPLGLGSRIDSIVTDASPAPARDTGEPLDFAVVGEGWFGVQTPQGTRYTRNGQFAVSPQGTLIDGMGNQVMGKGGGTVTVGKDGKVDPRLIGIFNLTGVRKIGNSYVTGAAGGAATGTVRQGALEGSNADPARSMVDMIASFRAFESGQRVIRTIDETLAKASNVVGGMP